MKLTPLAASNSVIAQAFSESRKSRLDATKHKREQAEKLKMSAEERGAWFRHKHTHKVKETHCFQSEPIQPIEMEFGKSHRSEGKEKLVCVAAPSVPVRKPETRLAIGEPEVSSPLGTRDGPQERKDKDKGGCFSCCGK